jgi:hypothetical protein
MGAAPSGGVARRALRRPPGDETILLDGRDVQRGLLTLVLGESTGTFLA